ncbi:MAG: hypothetical protein ABSF78_00150 [Candidatus Acidiferrales bacterium]|jgi:hypothetical protein
MSKLLTNETANTSLEQNSIREKLDVAFDALVVLSLQLVFRATVMARHWNY